MMKVHYLQHVDFEGLSSLESALCKMGCQITSTQLYLNQPLPSINDFDWLIIMGGPMAIHDEKKYSWLAEEKLFIQEAINAEKVVLGVCLGAQLIADALGAKVYKNKYKEIGWFNIEVNKALKNTAFAEIIPKEVEVFHWHGDTFDVPEGAQAIASSEACLNQGFIFKDKVLALQFHLETNLSSAQALISHCSSELAEGKYIQTERQILSDDKRFSIINQLMVEILIKMKSW